MAGTTLKLRDLRSGTTTTTDAVTQTPLCTFDTSTAGPGGTALNNCSIFITARCSLYDAADGQAGGEMIGAVFKVASTVMSKVGATTTIDAMTKDTGGAPNCDFSTSGTVITFYVTGVAATTIAWFGTMDIVVNQP